MPLFAAWQGLPGGDHSSLYRINRHLNVCRQINDARFFADFFSLESISIRYFI
ncbi:hypothetical protein BC2230_10854 [Burkholderia cepacia]